MCILSLYNEAKFNTPFMYEVLDKDTINIETFPHLSVAKRGYVSENNLLVSILSLGLYSMTLKRYRLRCPPTSQVSLEGLPQDFTACEIGYHYGHRPMFDGAF